MAMLWKEWRQQRWLVLIACVVGPVFPALELMTRRAPGREFRTEVGTGVVLGLGAFFAVILALATTQADVKRKLAMFWESRPVCPLRLVVVKFVVGALLLLVVFGATLSLDFWSYTSQDPPFADFAWRAFCYTYPVSLMLFAVTMLLVVLLRDATKAMLLALTAGLLVYFGPLLVGGLEWLNVFEQMDRREVPVVQEMLRRLDQGYPFKVAWRIALAKWRAGLGEYVTLLGFCGVGVVAALGLSVVALKRHWVWRPGQKTIAWTLGLAGCFVFGVSMFQVGHNLLPVTSPEGYAVEVSTLSSEPITFYDWTQRGIAGADRIAREQHGRGHCACSVGEFLFRVSTGIILGKGEAVPRWEESAERCFVLDVYRLGAVEEAGGGCHEAEVVFSAMGSLPRNRSLNVLGCFCRGDRLYVCYQPWVKQEERDGASDQVGQSRPGPIRLLTVGIVDVSRPERLGDEELAGRRHYGGTLAVRGEYGYVVLHDKLVVLSFAEGEGARVVGELAAEKVGKREKIITTEGYAFKDDLLVCWDRNQVMLFDVSEPAEPKAVWDEGLMQLLESRSGDLWELAVTCRGNYLYVSNMAGLYVLEVKEGGEGGYAVELAGERRATPLERLVGRRPKELLIYKGMLVENAGSFGVLVYDVSDAGRPRRAYHAGTGSSVLDIGVWEGLLFAEVYGGSVRFYDIGGRPETAAETGGRSG